MKILIFGSGVIGSIYGARLHEAHYHVTLLARGRRYEEVKQDGVIIKDMITGKRTATRIPIIQKLAVTDFYDLIIVAIRLDQLDAVIPVLKENLVCPLILFMLNNPEDTLHYMNELYPKHIILGFPGAGGVNRGKYIDYIQIRQQKTTIGEIDGKITKQLKKIKGILENASFEVDICANMPAWLKTHAVFVSCVTAAIMRKNGDSVKLSKKRASVQSMVRSIREGFLACKALGLPIKPTNVRVIFMVMPEWFTVLYWQHALKGKIGTLAMAPHANAATDEMRLLAKKVIAMVHSSPLLTPTLDKLLLSFIQSIRS